MNPLQFLADVEAALIAGETLRSPGGVPYTETDIRVIFEAARDEVSYWTD